MRHWFKYSILILTFLILIDVKMVFPASFDCSKAQTKTEQAICSDAYLSALDSVLGQLIMS